MDGAAHLSYRLKLKYPLPFSVRYRVYAVQIKKAPLLSSQNCKRVDIKLPVVTFSANRFVVLKTLHNNYTKGL